MTVFMNKVRRIQGRACAAHDTDIFFIYSFSLFVDKTRDQCKTSFKL